MEIPRIPRTEFAGSSIDPGANLSAYQVFHRERTKTAGIEDIATAAVAINQKVENRKADALRLKLDSEVATAMSDAQLLLDEKIRNNETVTDDDLKGFHSSVRKAMVGKEAPAGYQEFFDATLAKTQANLRGRYADANATVAENGARETFMQSYDTMLSNNNFDGADLLLQSATESRLFTPSQLSAYRENVTVGRETRKVFDMMGENPTADSIAKAREYVDGFASRKNLSPQMAAQLTASMGARVAQQEYRLEQAATAAVAAEKEQRTQHMAALEAAVRFGLPNDDGTRTFIDPSQLDVMRADGELDAVEYNSLYAHAQARIGKDDEKAIIRTKFQDKIASDEPVFLSTPEKKLFEEMVAEEFPPFQDYDAWPAQQKVEINRLFSNNLVPPQVNGLLMAGLSENSPTTTASAVTMAADLRKTAPEIWAQLDPKAQVFYASVDKTMSYGVSLEQAATEARQAARLTPDQRTIVDARLRKEMPAEDDYSRALRNRLDESELPDDPAAARQMVTDFMPLMQEAYRANGGQDKDIAADVAYARLTQKWAVSGLTGRTEDDPVMAMYPAERQPGNPQPFTSEEIRANLHEELATLPGYNAEKFDYALVPVDGRTERAVSADGTAFAGRAYHIKVIAKDPTDTPLALYVEDTNGQPIMWTPDYHKIVTGKIQAQTDAAKAEQERIKKLAKESTPESRKAEREAKALGRVLAEPM
jgi:hypothetical protein